MCLIIVEGLFLFFVEDENKIDEKSIIHNALCCLVFACPHNHRHGAACFYTAGGVTGRRNL